MKRCFPFACVVALIPFAASVLRADEPNPRAAIPRLLPPQGIKLSPDVNAKLTERLKQVENQLASLGDSPWRADAEVLAKAVRFALQFDEFYSPKDADKAFRQLALAEERIAQLRAGKHPWTNARGLVVRGYTSRVDGSAQPYGLVIPEKLDLSGPTPLYVWLHGRGDKSTDLHFIEERLTKPGQITLNNAIVLHPFGRQCVGFKSAGEIDVIEAIGHVQSQYEIDPNRIVLMGFSMGGAGCWHLGAHYADRFVAMSPGAGFAETAQYQHLTPDKYPPKYEQELWGQYDVPDYTRNLFNVTVVAYSGELDKQIQAARVMEQAFESEGRHLTHLIGPGMGHKYYPDTLAEILERMNKAVIEGRNPRPRQVSLQTRTLRYNRMFWVEAVSLEQHWRDSRIDANVTNGGVTVVTKNIGELRLHDWLRPDATLTIDDQQLVAPARPNANEVWQVTKRDGRWAWTDPKGKPMGIAKRHDLQGPIDDVFMGSFLVVTPSSSPPAKLLRDWFEFESSHQIDRWQALFRGQPRVKSADQVTSDDIERFHLILWGDAASNSLIAKVLPKLPMTWDASHVQIGDQQFDAATHIPVLIYPNPLNPQRYIVLNSGPTFREAHDRTNSLQNPKLPDWAVLDLRQPPNAEAAGRVVAAEFFDEHWRVRP